MKILEEFQCIICGQIDFDEVIPNKYDLLKDTHNLQELMSSSSSFKLVDALSICNVCGHLQTNPRLEMHSVTLGYESAVDPIHVAQDRFRMESFRSALNKIQKKIDLKAIQGLKILDVGCASGAFLKIAQEELGCKVKGIEPAIWMCDFGKREYGLEIIQGYFNDKSFENEKFDIISFWDVLEHIPDPNQVLQTAFDRLTENGLLIINVPNSSSVASKILGKRWPFLLAVHIHYFTNNSIRELLRNNGFEVIYHRPYFQKLGALYLMNRALNILNIKISIGNKFSFLDNFAFKYNMGQTTFVAQRKLGIKGVFSND